MTDWLLSRIMAAILVVLGTDVFQHFFARSEFPEHVILPRLRERSGIFDGHVNAGAPGRYGGNVQ